MSRLSSEAGQSLHPASPNKNSPWRDSRFLEVHAAIKGAAHRIVGSLGLTEAIRVFRQEMVDRALLQANGSRRAAARILGVTRPAVQSILRQSTQSDQ
jgi:transcriptional regulator with GAF, ATPase, and Fis domain